MSMSVTKIFEFCYSHCLPFHKGKCKNLHGHTGRLEVEVERKRHEISSMYVDENGLVVDYADIKAIVNPFLEKLDHHYLNDVLGKKYLPPTSENLVYWFLDNLYSEFFNRGLVLVRIRVYESSTSYAEWRKEG